jgi:hypothetical protein
MKSKQIQVRPSTADGSLEFIGVQSVAGNPNGMTPAREFLK